MVVVFLLPPGCMERTDTFLAVRDSDLFSLPALGSNRIISGIDNSEVLVIQTTRFTGGLVSAKISTPIWNRRCLKLPILG